MNWIALACTADNYVLAWHESLSLLESACGSEFRAICRIYGVDEVEYQQLKNNNVDFKIKFSGPRNTSLIGAKKPTEVEELSLILRARVSLVGELHQRIAHGYKRFTDVVPWQQEAYQYKTQQAWSVLGGIRDPESIGFIQDYADAAGLDLEVAARMITVKSMNQQDMIRKLEYLRIKHQEAIRCASNKIEFAQARAAMDEDAFLSMLM